MTPYHRALVTDYAGESGEGGSRFFLRLRPLLELVLSFQIRLPREEYPP